MEDKTNFRRLVLTACTIACTVILAIVYQHPETKNHFSLLYIPEKFVHTAFAETRELNSRSQALKQELEALESSLGLSSENLNGRSQTNAADHVAASETKLGHRPALHEGYSEDVQRKSEDIEEEAKERIKSGEWPPEIVQKDQEKGFIPKDYDASSEPTSVHSDQRASLLAIAENQAKRSLKQDFESKERALRTKELALKRVFRYKELLLSRVAQELAANQNQGGDSRGHWAPIATANLRSSTEALPSAAASDELIGQSGLVVGDGTRLRKDAVPVGFATTAGDRSSDLSAGRRGNPIYGQQQLSIHPVWREAAAATHHHRAAVDGRRRAAEEDRRHAAEEERSGGEHREGPSAGEWLRPAARQQGLTWPPPLQGVAARQQQLAATALYNGDYNWPSTGQVVLGRDPSPAFSHAHPSIRAQALTWAGPARPSAPARTRARGTPALGGSVRRARGDGRRG